MMKTQVIYASHTAVVYLETLIVDELMVAIGNENVQA